MENEHEFVRKNMECIRKEKLVENHSTGMSSKNLSGFLLFFIGIIFGLWETQYFGNNLFPKTFLELCADCISLSMCFFGAYFIGRKY